MIGLNFYPPSPRCISLERATEIRHAIGRRATVIGVFVNATRDYVGERMRELELDMLQFHGDEDEDAIRGWPVEVIRAFRLRADVPDLTLPATAADYVLLDTFHPGQRAKVLTPALRARILAATRRKPGDRSTHWSCRRLAAGPGFR